MLFEIKPDNFNPKFEIASCFVKLENKILLLLRNENKPEGNTWGIPTGKITECETPFAAILRELKEETGLTTLPGEIIFLKELSMRFPTYDFKASVFELKLKRKPKIKINISEHNKFLWIDLDQVSELPLIYDLDNWISLFYKTQIHNTR